jgi:hypothetical protein
MPKKVCFMVMPYGRKPTQAEAGKGPAQIDFNALWDRCYVPVIEALDYQPVRADLRRACRSRNRAALRQSSIYARPNRSSCQYAQHCYFAPTR